MVEKTAHVLRVDELRRRFLQRTWQPKNSWLYKFSQHIFHPQFWEAFQRNNNKEIVDTYFQKITCTGLCLVPNIFSEKFRIDLLEEVKAFQRAGLPLVQPNTLNRYGTVLSDLGMEVFHDLFINLKNLFSEIFPVETRIIDSVHPFVVQYKQEEQKSLGFHYDDSEFTLNLCLGSAFTGGDLYFHGLRDDEVTQDENYVHSHVPGQALLHLGRHRHGAMPITSGERYNLIIWFRCSQKYI
eukprot:TRINITY_DN9409_c0_g1_i2.p1 TRINITY_DN9409_c0_g1~~TRINITY_DN9409_c0_g1_i2.p1  ORF type:complete len:240 (-),score=34.75 TRINITY_DN9409_c0_g1_i2:160-879(-)